jgi:hypothetical protein
MELFFDDRDRYAASTRHDRRIAWLEAVDGKPLSSARAASPSRVPGRKTRASCSPAATRSTITPAWSATCRGSAIGPTSASR